MIRISNEATLSIRSETLHVDLNGGEFHAEGATLPPLRLMGVGKVVVEGCRIAD
jgi:hypothetical protein